MWFNDLSLILSNEKCILLFDYEQNIQRRNAIVEYARSEQIIKELKIGKVFLCVLIEAFRVMQQVHTLVTCDNFFFVIA